MLDERVYGAVTDAAVASTEAASAVTDDVAIVFAVMLVVVIAVSWSVLMDGDEMDDAIRR